MAQRTRSRASGASGANSDDNEQNGGTIATAEAPERHGAGAQSENPQGHAASRGAEAARARCHRNAVDVAGGIHQVRRGRNETLGAAREIFLGVD